MRSILPQRHRRNLKCWAVTGSGRDAQMSSRSTPDLPSTISDEAWRIATEAPRRYGFHATLKPPFKLAPGTSADDLKSALQAFAQTQKAFLLPRLTLGKLGRFLALILSEPSPAMHELAADCFREFDSFRASAEADDIAKRMHASLNEAERRNLLAWGYPYVLDTWKFHMTLTKSLDVQVLETFRDHLAGRFCAACEEPVMCDSICLFEEPAPNSAMLLTARFALAQ